MLRHVAYIGYGFVGRACERVFKDNSDSITIDPKTSPGYTYDHIHRLRPALTFVSVPAPTTGDGSVDASAIYEVFGKLNDLQYTGLVVLKSTVPPAIVRDLREKFPELDYVYSPEFLREAHWEEDALKPRLIVIGGSSRNCFKLKEYYQKHSAVWGIAHYHFTNFEQAALVKYTLNSYLAMKVVFMDQLKSTFHDAIPGATQENWEDFTDILGSDSRFGDSHMQVPGPDGKLGYGGSCFPKDVRAMLALDKNEHLTLLKEASIVNTKLRLESS